MTSLFISDLHLNPRQPELAQGFIRFLTTTASDAQALYIIGDFFDAWIGDDEDADFAINIKNHLLAYSRDHQVFLQRGNRDFLLGEQFAQDTGSELLADETVIELNGQRVLLMHGDSLCTLDHEYMAFRQMVRNPAWQAQVLAMPLAARRQMAQDIRAKSQSMNAMKAEDIMDVTPSEVERVMAEHQVQCLIHGHTHRPAIHSLSVNGLPARRIVLGDWGQHSYYAKANGDVDLMDFAIP